MKNDKTKKYLFIGITAFCVVAACILLFFILFKISSIFYHLGKILSYLMPIVYGIILAYLLLPLNNWLNEKFLKRFSKKMKKERTARRTAKILATTISILFALIIVAGLISLVAPQVYNSVMSIISTLPDKINDLKSWVNGVFDNHPYIQEFISSALVTVENYFKDLATNGSFLNYTSDILSIATSGIKALVSLAENIIVGVIIAIYVLNSSKLFAAQAKKLTYSLFKVKTANSIIHNFRYTHKMIGGFINGRLLDSLIIGIICFICMAIFRMPYAVLISVIVGITNIIPFFGPFIGAIPSTLLILTVDPKKAFGFVIFIIVLQQFDGNILGPKISSNLTGLSGFWVMFSLLLFGGMFGVWGMLLGVPVFAVIKTLISEWIDRKLKRKHLPVTTCTYLTTGYVEPLISDDIVDASSFNDEENGDEENNNENEDGETEQETSSFVKSIKGLVNKISKKIKK